MGYLEDYLKIVLNTIFPFSLKKKWPWRLKDGSLGKVFSEQALTPESGSSYPRKKSDSAECAYNPSTVQAETRGLPRFAGEPP